MMPKGISSQLGRGSNLQLAPKRPKVLHLIPTLRVGGAERLVADLVTAPGHYCSHEVATMFPAEQTCYEGQLREAGIPLHHCRKRPGLDMRLPCELYRLFARTQPDVLHTHLYALRYALVPAIVRRVPVVVHTIHTLAQHEDFRPALWIYRLAFRFHAVQPVAISESLRASARLLYGARLDLPVIPNGIRTDPYLRTRSGGCAQSPVLRILNVARLDPVKNHLFLLAIAQELERLKIPFTLHIAGDGPMRERIAAETAARGLKHRVQLLGQVTDVVALYAAADVFVLPSTREGLPMALLEAMASSLAVVASPVGGIPEVLSDGVCGLLLPVDKPAAWAAALAKLSADAGLRQRLGMAAREKVLRHYDIQVTAKHYEDLYEKLLIRHRGYLAPPSHISERPYGNDHRAIQL